ncbi:uncharacterized protein LTR77_004907 [Saxophila tyrrhenica]|uniref:O-methyltransferase C-terminal domain-containing protein n=1 Tax=Saxophila tyrrhenica TaxID=1690608 RepID=A0AAV9PB46_9PEZI|nr:hypothetical protein LTR77_004907 [Saxophila tyrrhenica]
MAKTTGHLVALATRILEQAKALEAYHEKQDTPLPSFDESASEGLNFPREMEKTRATISDACEELNALVQDPRMMMQSRVMAHLLYFDVVHRFKITSKVPLNGSISYSELSKQTGVSEAALRRVLRFAISNHVFAEKQPGFISHSAASRLLVDDPTMFDWVGSVVQEITPAQLAEGKALEKYPEADESSKTGYMVANKATEQSFYLHMAKEPERVRQFGSAMSGFAKGRGHSLDHLVNNFPWGELGSGTVVDLGGGATGGAAFAIGEKYPDLNLIVQDLPDTVAGAEEKPGVNVKFQAHSFFDEQPVKGADVYMSRWCFHNWSDKYCTKILNALIPALKPGARILIMDAVLPQIGSGAVLSNEERRLRNFDVTMMALSASQERELEDWKALFAAVDSRYRWKGVAQPEGSNLALIEAVWDP